MRCTISIRRENEEITLILISTLLISPCFAEQTSNANYNDPVIQSLSPLLDHTHEVNTYVDTNQKDVDWGTKTELVLWMNEDKDSKFLPDEVRIDASHEVESGEYRAMLVTRVPLYKLWK